MAGLSETTYRQIRDTSSNFCWQNVAAKIELRPCDASLRAQEFILADSLDIVYPFDAYRIRARSGNCVSAPATGGVQLSLIDCATAARWYGGSGFDFPVGQYSIRRVDDSGLPGDFYAGAAQAVSGEPVAARRAVFCGNAGSICIWEDGR